jgi:hypothetical protein
MIEHSLASGDGGYVFERAGNSTEGFPALAQALGHAFEMGAVTPEMLDRLMGSEGLGGSEPSVEFARLIAASGSDALQTEVAARLWTQAGGNAWGQAVALKATGGSGPAF